MEFNINYRVKVKLTDHGRKLHKEKHQRFWLNAGRPDLAGSYISPPEDGEGWSSWALWELMSDFGEFIHVASPLVFETVIQIPENPIS